MRTILICLPALILLNITIAQSEIDNGAPVYGIEKYKLDIINPVFSTVFETEEDLNDFKQLREFLREREDILRELNYQTANYRDRSSDISSYESRVQLISKAIADKNDSEKIALNLSDFSEDLYNMKLRVLQDIYSINYYSEGWDQQTLYFMPSQARSMISEYTTEINKARTETDYYIKLTSNISNINQDIKSCARAIDNALAPEYADQDFRKAISFIFASLIGTLLLVFFFIVYVKSDKNLSKELLSGQGLQFITLFVLIIAIILFGILNILQGSELAAILAGISGYILGKGIPETKKDNEGGVPSDTN